MQKRINKFLPTGLPGYGKTTVIVRLSDILKARKTACLFTREIRDKGQSTGFSSQTFGGKKSILSSINFKKGPKVGGYKGDIDGFEKIVLPELALNRDTDLYLIYVNGLYIGEGKELDAGSFFTGLIDDVRIYDVALTSEEIEAMTQ